MDKSRRAKPDATSAGAEHRQDIIVLEEETGRRQLAIAADPEEGRRLVREVSRNPESEHPIYDLIERLLRTFDAMPTHVMLRYLAGAGLEAGIAFRLPQGEVAITCHPSDALALAHRAHVPIYVNADVFSEVRPFASQLPPTNEHGAVADWLARIRPADFGADGPEDRP